MLTPLEQWYCDVCGEVIEKPEDGYVVWQNDAQAGDHSFTIIHQSRCDRGRLSASAALTDFTGERGTARLLAMMSRGNLLLEVSESHRGANQVRNLDEFVDFFRRVQVPYYEEARTLFSDPALQERFADANEIYPYLPETLEYIIENFRGSR